MELKTIESGTGNRTPVAFMLRQYRGTFDLTMRELAIKIGTSAATLSRIERGGTPDLETWAKLQKWLLGK